MSRRSIVLAILLPLILSAISAVNAAERRRQLDGVLYEAVRSGNVARVERALAAGANVNGVRTFPFLPQYTDSVLEMAVRQRNPEVLPLLLRRGADPRTPGNDSVLWVAAGNGDTRAVRLLLDAGASVNDFPGGSSALFAAATNGHTGIVRLLLARGANPNSQDREGKSVLWAAREASPGGTPLVEKLLLEAGARL